MTSTKPQDYSNWTQEDLIARVTKLEQQLSRQLTASTSSPSLACTPSPPPKRKARSSRQFDPSKYNTRYIALRLAYLGQNYNGFEHHANNTTPLPTIEEELWKALAKVKLIFPTSGTEGAVDWDGCEYSKCGRTDRGVSAFGQVIVLKVRSSKPLLEYEEVIVEDADGTEIIERRRIHWDPVKDELSYTRMLNRVLPEDIRILAWCEAPTPEFSARFSCKERRYRYFFTQPAFAPRPGAAGINGRGRRDGWLDISAMRQAAKYFEGLHDFRNFCKVDPSKQIQSFERRVFVAEIEETTSSTGMPAMTRWSGFAPDDCGGLLEVEKQPTVCEFRVSGSGFLWHQVRHMAAVLFLVGQGLESPTIVRDLLDVEKESRKPHYEMADDAPLVLWDCVFPADGAAGPDKHVDALDWILPEDQVEQPQGSVYADGRYGPTGLNDNVWSQWRRRKVDEVLASSLFDIVAGQARGFGHASHSTVNGNATTHPPPNASIKVFDGGDSGKSKGEYMPLLQRERGLSVSEQNRRYLVRKGLPAKRNGIAPDISHENAIE